VSERPADPRCTCGAPHSDPLHVIDHQFVMATDDDERPPTTREGGDTAMQLWEIRPAVVTDDLRPQPVYGSVSPDVVEMGRRVVDALRDADAEIEAKSA